MGITETDFKRIQSNSHEPQISLRRQIFTHWIKNNGYKNSDIAKFIHKSNPATFKVGYRGKDACETYQQARDIYEAYDADSVEIKKYFNKYLKITRF